MNSNLQFLLNSHIIFIGLALLIVSVYEFWKKHIRRNYDTDNIDLVDRYVKYSQIKKKNRDMQQVLRVREETRKM